MSEKPKPQWHLSTAVTMMVIAGTLLPLVIWAYRRSMALDAEGNNLQGFYGVLIVCGMIVYYTGRVSEWLVRRREARTAVLVLISTVVMLGLNFVPKRIDVLTIAPSIKLPRGFYKNLYGWPFTALSEGVFYDGPSEQNVSGTDLSVRILINNSDSTAALEYVRPMPCGASDLSYPFAIGGDKVFYRDRAAINALVVVGILFCVALGSEWLIRRREARKT